MRDSIKYRFQLAIFVALAVLFGVALAQAAFDPLKPSEWFVSQEVVLAVGAWLAMHATSLLTALGKDWFHTDGKETQLLAAAFSALIAGVGGYLSLGYLSNQSGISGAIMAAVMAIIAFLGATGSAERQRQAITSAIERSKVKLNRP